MTAGGDALENLEVSIELFELVGHDCPLGEYPSVVVPVGMINGELFVVYSQTDRTVQLVPIAFEAKYLRHGKVTASGLVSFEPRRHGLFALSESMIFLVPLGQEAAFYADLLRSSLLEGADQFYRLSLALETRNPGLIAPLLWNCFAEITEISPDLAQQWSTQFREYGELLSVAGYQLPFDLPRNIGLEAGVSEAQQQQSPLPSGFGQCVLFGRMPFLGRGSLRHALSDLLTEEGARVLEVTGGPGSGKSYTSELIRYVGLTNKIRPFNVVYFSLGRGFPMITVEEVAREIGSWIGGSIPMPAPISHTTSSSLIRAYKEWIVATLKLSGRFHWVIFDDLSEEAVSPDALELIDLLIKDLQQGTYVDLLRLVLMGRKARRLPRGRFIRRETLRIDDLRFEDIRAYFNLLDPKASAEATKMVWQKWQGSLNDERSLKFLNQTVISVSVRYAM